MKIGIISTGNELLRGAIADTNAAWIASRLYERGYETNRIVIAGDDLDELEQVLKWAFETFELTVVGGGLGPTGDDITSEAAGRAAGKTLIRDPEARAQVEQAFVRIGRSMAEINLKQADLPEGSQVLRNRRGTAPGFSLATPKGRAYFLPGVPHEIKPMFEQYVLADLPDRSSARHEAVFRCFGMGESNIQAALTPLHSSFTGLRLSFRASFPEIGITVRTPDAVTLSAVQSEIRNILGRAVFAEEEIGLPEALGKALVSAGATAATAESCTGGLIGHLITEVSGSSAYFKGGITAYDNSVKVLVLGVDASVIQAHGAVSEPVVKAMAQGVRRALATDLGLATSGIAGPTGGTPEKPVGLVHMAVATSERIAHKRHVFTGYDRSRVKQAAAWTVLKMALDALKEAT